MKNVWIVAMSPLGSPYPCRCGERGGRDCGGTWCPCWGRGDVALMPVGCCSRRKLPVLDALVTRQ